MKFFLIAFCLCAAFLFANPSHRVAAVGNSITFGYGFNWGDTTYPMKLQNILSLENFADTVANFGVSGSTIEKNDNAAYWTTYQFTPALDFKADIIIIELGTNDSKNFTQWISNNDSLEEIILNDYKALIDTFLFENESAKIWACLAPYANNSSWGILDTAIQKHINPTLLKAAIQKGVAVIDLHSSFDSKLLDASDTVHPTVEGAAEMARVISSYLLRDTLRILQNKTELRAPAGYDFNWYKNGELLDETSQVLKISETGDYKVSVRIEENTQSRVIATIRVEDLEQTSSSFFKTRKQNTFLRNNTLYLPSARISNIHIFDLQGRLLKAFKTTESSVSLPSYNEPILIRVQNEKETIFLKRR